MLQRLICLTICLLAVGCATGGNRSHDGIVVVRPTITTTPTPRPTATPTPTPSPTTTPNPTATPTSPPSPTPTNTPIPSSTPTPLPSPTPTARSAARTILWDLSHGPRVSSSGLRYRPAELFSDLTALLRLNQIALVENLAPLGEQDLTAFDAVVIAATSAVGAAYTGREAGLLADYVAAGGGVLILAEAAHFETAIGPVVEQFGVSAARSSGVAAVTALADHPIFNGVTALRFFDGGALAVRSSTATTTATAGGAPVVVIQTLGAGRIAIVGDSNLFDNRWLDDNQQFAINLFGWVAGRE